MAPVEMPVMNPGDNMVPIELLELETVGDGGSFPLGMCQGKQSILQHFCLFVWP